MSRSTFLALLALVTVTTGSIPAGARVDAQRHVVRHLDGALQLLSARDLSSLSERQRANRARAIETLIRYRDAGAFPRNHDFADAHVPYFVDQRSGAVCAVGHLMVTTGHAALVERISTADNHVRVADLATNPEVAAWLDEHGLTLEEAARIQPAYGWEPTPEPAPRPMLSRSATSGISVASGALSVLTLFPPSPRFATAARLVGFATSATTILAGADLARVQQHRSTASSALAVGGIGVGVAVGSWLYARNAPTRTESRWRISPMTDGRQVFVSVHRR